MPIFLAPNRCLPNYGLAVLYVAGQPFWDLNPSLVWTATGDVSTTPTMFSFLLLQAALSIISRPSAPGILLQGLVFQVSRPCIWLDIGLCLSLVWTATGSPVHHLKTKCSRNLASRTCVSGEQTLYLAGHWSLLESGLDSHRQPCPSSQDQVQKESPPTHFLLSQIVKTLHVSLTTSYRLS